MAMIRPIFQAGMRAARQGSANFAKSRSSAPFFNSRQALRFQVQPKRFASRYSRFGDGPSNGSQQQQQPKWSNFGPLYRAQFIWRNYRRTIIVAGVGGGVFYVYNLEEAPITRRLRFNVMSPSLEMKLAGGPEAYNSILNELGNKMLPADHPSTVQVAQVVERLLPTAHGLAGGDWRVHVIDDPKQKNAFVMPGGKVFVFTGILPICQDENGLAAVLGHEIAHNVAHHVAEKASRSILTILGTIGLSLLLGVDNQFGGSILELAFSLPNSRTQEAEADHIGLLMMAEACYDPQSAADFWNRMKQAEQHEPPQFLSTHPSNFNRMGEINRLLPDAQRIYDDTGCGSVNRYTTAFAKALNLGGSGPKGRPSRQQPVAVAGRKETDSEDFF